MGHHARTSSFSPALQEKITLLSARAKSCQLGRLSFPSNLLLAPMSAICNIPFRLLMEELGAGGTVSELISCHGINHKNEKTLSMLKIHPREKNIGIQLFGEDAHAMADAAKIAEDFGPKFIDINMGCPVRKVVSKGGGSALLKNPKQLGQFFNKIKASINLPLTIKIRTGWDEENINATEVIHIAKSEGIEFVAVHGRTRSQGYNGLSNWKLLEDLATNSPLPLIGNGDLHNEYLVRKRSQTTNCQALMLGRGPLRNPFIFLESLKNENEDIYFTPLDYLEIIHRYLHYLGEYSKKERHILTQGRKMIVWFSSGLKNSSQFRGKLFSLDHSKEVLKETNLYFQYLHDEGVIQKSIDLTTPFMAGGHG